MMDPNLSIDEQDDLCTYILSKLIHASKIISMQNYQPGGSVYVVNDIYSVHMNYIFEDIINVHNSSPIKTTNKPKLGRLDIIDFGTFISIVTLTLFNWNVDMKKLFPKPDIMERLLYKENYPNGKDLEGCTNINYLFNELIRTSNKFVLKEMYITLNQ